VQWVADGSPTHSSTPVRIESALQFVPKNTDPREFKKLQQQVNCILFVAFKEYRLFVTKSSFMFCVYGRVCVLLKGMTIRSGVFEEGGRENSAIHE
jgi:hypothetical protein